MDAAPAITPETGPAAPSGPRLEFIDNLRWVMIILVVSMHGRCDLQSPGEPGNFMEEAKPGQIVLVVFAAYQMFLQAFLHGVALSDRGIFVPGAFDRKGLDISCATARCAWESRR